MAENKHRKREGGNNSKNRSGGRFHLPRCKTRKREAAKGKKNRESSLVKKKNGEKGENKANWERVWKTR